MTTETISLEEKIKLLTRNFLVNQLGENPEKVECLLNQNICFISASTVISPAEKLMMQTEADQQMIQNYKIQEFNLVKADLAGEIEQLLGKRVSSIQCSITEDSYRNITVSFKK